MKPPAEPNEEDCCHSGCNPCIFDIYAKQVRLYEKYLSGETHCNDNIVTTENVISQLEYTHFAVEKYDILCDSHVLLGFKTINKERKERINRRVWWNPGDHFLFKYNSDETTCTRAYTPIKIYTECDFSIIVKIYNNGIVSNYLKNLKAGDDTLWRGPYGNYKATPNFYNRIIMIAQGTGIAPFISIIENIVSNEDDMTRIILYYCVKSEDLILLRDELYSFKQYWNFSYKIFLSSFSSRTNYKYEEPIVNHKLGLEDFTQFKPFTSSDQILLCGSFAFMEHFKKILKMENSDNIVLF